MGRAVGLEFLVGRLIAVDDHFVAGLPHRDTAPLPNDPGRVRAPMWWSSRVVTEHRNRHAARAQTLLKLTPAAITRTITSRGPGSAPRCPRSGRRPWARPRAPGVSPRRSSSSAAARLDVELADVLYICLCQVELPPVRGRSQDRARPARPANPIVGIGIRTITPHTEGESTMAGKRS